MPTDKPIRVIQAKGGKAGIPRQIGALCYSKKKSTRKGEVGEETMRETFYIRNNEQGTIDFALFKSILDYTREDGMYVFKAIDTPIVLWNVESKLNLQSKTDDIKVMMEVVRTQGVEGG